MSICIQVVNTPELEHLEQRVFDLPTIGGSLGRSLACDIKLPDHSKKLSRLHAKIDLVDNGDYLIKDLSSNGLKVNQILLGYGNTRVLRDGDILEMGGYQMFISNFDTQLKVNKKDQPRKSQPRIDKQFSMGFMDKSKDGQFPSINYEFKNQQDTYLERKSIERNNIKRKKPFEDIKFNPLKSGPQESCWQENDSQTNYSQTNPSQKNSALNTSPNKNGQVKMYSLKVIKQCFKDYSGQGGLNDEFVESCLKNLGHKRENK